MSALSTTTSTSTTDDDNVSSSGAIATSCCYLIYSTVVAHSACFTVAISSSLASQILSASHTAPSRWLHSFGLCEDVTSTFSETTSPTAGVIRPSSSSDSTVSRIVSFTGLRCVHANADVLIGKHSYCRRMVVATECVDVCTLISPSRYTKQLSCLRRVSVVCPFGCCRSPAAAVLSLLHDATAGMSDII
jgi:hypothetical protein